MYPMNISAHDAAWLEKAKALKPAFASRARKVDELGGWPDENFKDLREQGFLKLGVPREYGGFGGEDAGFSFVCNAVVEIFASACGSTGWALQNQYHSMGLVNGMANEEQKKRILGDIAENGALISSVGSEVQPNKSVSTPGKDGKISFQSGFVPVEGGFEVSGVKGFTSGGAASKYLLFWVLAPGTDDPDVGVTVGVIELPNAGVEWLKGWEDAVGIRASLSGGAKFKNVFIPWRNMLGEPGDYNQIHPYTFEITYCTHLLGISQGIYEAVIATMAEREFLQKDDTNMYAVGEMATAIHATRTMWWHAQELYDRKDWDRAGHTTLLALHQAKVTAALVSNKAFEVIGTRAVFRWNPIERLWRDARVASLHTRENLIMRTVAQGEISGKLFAKAKYGRRLPQSERKTWKDLGLEAEPEPA